MVGWMEGGGRRDEQRCARAGGRAGMMAGTRASARAPHGTRSWADGRAGGRAASWAGGAGGLVLRRAAGGRGERVGHVLPVASGSSGIPVGEASNSQASRQLAMPRACALARDGKRKADHHHRSSTIDKPSSSSIGRSSMIGRRSTIAFEARPSSPPMTFHRH